MFLLGELIHALNLSKPKIVFVSSNTVGKIVKAATKSSFVKNVICFDDKQPSKIVTKYSQFISNPKVSEYFLYTKPFNSTALFR